MTKRDAKRQAYRYVLGLMKNFGDSWERQLPKDSALDRESCEDAMEELIALLKRGARPSERQRLQAKAQHNE